MNNPQGGGGSSRGVDYGDGNPLIWICRRCSFLFTVLKGASATQFIRFLRGEWRGNDYDRKRFSSPRYWCRLTSSVTFETPLVLPNYKIVLGRGSNGQFPH